MTVSARRHPLLQALLQALLPALLAGLLSACGGGAGDTQNATASTAAGSTPGGFDTALYAGAPLGTGIVAVDGRNWINYRRSQIGVPVLMQNALIDRAAANHSAYQRINNVIGHDEDPDAAGFTGVGLNNRLDAVAYSLEPFNYSYGEVISATTNTSGFFMAEELVTAIYHRFVLFEPVFKEIGTGSGTTTANYTYFTADLVTNHGYGPGLGRGRMVVWPVNGQTGVVPNFFSNREEPDPVDTADEVGYPVSVHADAYATILVSNFTIRPRNGANLPVKLLHYTTDAHTPKSATAIIPLTRLAAATVYDVAFSGSVDERPVSMSWSFSTR